MQRKLSFMLFLLVAGIFSLHADNVQVTRRLNITKQLRVTDNEAYYNFSEGRLIVDCNSGKNAISYIQFHNVIKTTQHLSSAQLFFKVKLSSTGKFCISLADSWPNWNSYSQKKDSANSAAILVDNSLSDLISSIKDAAGSDSVEFLPVSKDNIQSVNILKIIETVGNSPINLCFWKPQTGNTPLYFRGVQVDKDPESYIELTYSVPSENLTTTMHMEGYKSYYDPHFARKVDAHTVAYLAQTTNQTNTVRLVPISDGIIPAGTPVILKTNQHDANNYHLSLMANSDIDPIDDNLLKVSDENTSISNAYRLGWKEGIGVGFFLFDFSTSSQSGVVYLDPSDVNTTNASEIHFIIDDSNGIEALPTDSSIDAQVYDLTGASCTSMQSGKIYIQNRKIVIKP